MAKIRDEIEKEVAKTEAEIMDSLQRFHDLTGMVPGCVSFEVINIDINGQSERKSLMVTNVNLTSYT